MYSQSDYILFYYLCQISSLDNGTVGVIFNDSTVLKSRNLIIRHIILLNKFQPFVIVDYRSNMMKQARGQANGAYNIARKGLWIVEQFKKADNVSTVEPVIHNDKWLKFVQENDMANN